MKGNNNNSILSDLIGKKVIVRGNSSGVFFGTLAAKQGPEVELTNCRCLWYWVGATSIIQIAAEGVKQPDDCKFTVTVERLAILDAIEIIPCTDAAAINIENVKEWKIQ